MFHVSSRTYFTLLSVFNAKFCTVLPSIFSRNMELHASLTFLREVCSLESSQSYNLSDLLSLFAYAWAFFARQLASLRFLFFQCFSYFSKLLVFCFNRSRRHMFGSGTFSSTIFLKVAFKLASAMILVRSSKLFTDRLRRASLPCSHPKRWFWLLASVSSVLFGGLLWLSGNGHSPRCRCLLATWFWCSGLPLAQWGLGRRS